jgi:hypothetical protein
MVAINDAVGGIVLVKSNVRLSGAAVAFLREQSERTGMSQSELASRLVLWVQHVGSSSMLDLAMGIGSPEVARSAAQHAAEDIVAKYADAEDAA